MINRGCFSKNTLFVLQKALQVVGWRFQSLLFLGFRASMEDAPGPVLTMIKLAIFDSSCD